MSRPIAFDDAAYRVKGSDPALSRLTFVKLPETGGVESILREESFGLLGHGPGRRRSRSRRLDPRTAAAEQHGGKPKKAKHQGVCWRCLDRSLRTSMGDDPPATCTAKAARMTVRAPSELGYHPKRRTDTGGGWGAAGAMSGQ